MLLKIHSSVIPSHSSFSISLRLSPSVAGSFSQWYLCLFVSVHFIGMGCDSPSLSLFVRFVSPFISCLLPSLALSLQKIWQGIETGERLLFSLTHSSFLKSKPTEAKSGYYLSFFFFFFFFAQGLWNSTLWKETEGSRSVKTRMGASWTFTGDCCINQEQKENSKFWSVRWTSDRVCGFVCLCTYACFSVC